MIKRKLKLIITFRTTTEAMAMETMCKEEKLHGRIIPVPKQITASCGLAWCTELENYDIMKTEMHSHDIIPEGIFECLV